MKNVIKIEEIKMYLGTVLQCRVKYVGGIIIDTVETLNYINPNCGHELNVLIKSNDIGFGIDEIIPFVKPLSKLTDEDNAKIESYNENYTRLEMTMQQINYLASKHYDIFNWIGRGLAIKKED